MYNFDNDYVTFASTGEAVIDAQGEPMNTFACLMAGFLAGYTDADEIVNILRG